MPAQLKVLLVGFGNVGRALARELVASRYDLRVVGVVTTRGLYRAPANWKAWLADLADSYPDTAEAPAPADLRDVIATLRPDVAFVTLPPSYRTGEPNLTVYRTLLSEGVSVITSDKTGLAMAFDEIMELARSRDAFVGWRATVMAGTPAIDVARGLRGREVRAVRGVLSATANYVLSRVEDGASLSEALSEAVKMRLTEPDPSVDLEGLDSAAKLVILLKTAGLAGVKLSQVQRAPLTSVSEDDVRGAARRGMRVRYVAEFSGGSARVGPQLLDGRDFLASVRGSYNAVVFEVDNETVTLSGPGGGVAEAVKSMMADLRELYELLAP